LEDWYSGAAYLIPGTAIDTFSKERVEGGLGFGTLGSGVKVCEDVDLLRSTCSSIFPEGASSLVRFMYTAADTFHAL
jgi:hypothetical protein